MLTTRTAKKPADGEDAAASSEAEIIRAVVGGDREAFRHLVTRYKNRIFALVMRQVGSRSVAEELTQEIFVKAFLHMRTFRFDSAFSTWLTRIAINHTHSYFGSRRYKQSSRTDEFLPEQHSGSAESPETGLERTERMRRFQLALAGLSPKLHAALTLCALEGKSYEEAAAILRVPVGTVRSRLNTARLQLKTAIESFCGGAG